MKYFLPLILFCFSFGALAADNILYNASGEKLNRKTKLPSGWRTSAEGAAGKQPSDSASDERPDRLQSRFEHSCPVDFKFHVLFPFLSVLFFDLTPMATEGLRYHYAWSFAL